MASGSGNILPVEIFQLLESSDTSQNVREAILENLASSKETWLIPHLVDYYFRTQSSNVKEILSELRETHTKVLMEKLHDGVKTHETRLSALQLVLYLVYKELPWCHQILEMPFFSSIIKCLKTEHDVPILMTSLMIVVILLPSAPVSMGKMLQQIFDIFGRLTLFCVRKPANSPELFLLHLQVGLYSLFHRLYGMYPCSFLDYIGHFFSHKENLMAYQEVVMPMLERVRLHPNIVMSKGQNETDTNRWKNQETQDIIVNCSKLSLDLIEGSQEESQCPIYQSVQAMGTRANTVGAKALHGTAASNPVAVPSMLSSDTHSDSQLLTPWTEETVVVGESPSVLIGLSTPPSSQRTTPAISFLETHLNGGTSGATPDSASRQATPCYGGADDGGDKTPLSSNRSSVSHNLSKLSDSSKKQTPTVVTPKATTAPHTTPVMGGIHHSGGPLFQSPVTVTTPQGGVAPDGGSPLRSQSSAFTSPRQQHSRSPAMRSIQFSGHSEGGGSDSGDSPIPHTLQGKQVSASNSPEETTKGRRQDKTQSTVRGQGSPGKSDVDRRGRHRGENLEDQEVEEINEREDQFNVEGSPTSSISTQASQTEVTAESVRQFMKKVNRIRFNSLTSNSSSEHDTHNKVVPATGMERRRRPRSCPPLKRMAHRWSLDKKGWWWANDEEFYGMSGRYHQQRSGSSHHHGRRSRQSRKSWKREEGGEGRVEEEEGDGDGTEEISEESSEDYSQGGGPLAVPRITIAGTGGDAKIKAKSTQNASTQVVPAFPPDINPAFQMMFAPSKIAICSKCQHDVLLTSNHRMTTTTITSTTTTTTSTTGEQEEATLAPGSKVTTIKGSEVSLFNAMSPPELLDRHLKLGSELHAKELNKIPLTSKDTVNWTHFGGVPPADEVNILKGQILLMQAQLMYERHKRSNHAKRNRRLLRRIAHEAKLEEQQKTLTDQIRLLEQEVQQLSVSIKLVQEDNRRLRLGQESDEYSKLVQYKSSIQENKDLRASTTELKKLLLTQKEDYDKLQKKLEHVEHINLEQGKDLKNCKATLANTEKLKGQVFKLQKELLLMQELHLKYQEKLHYNFPSQHLKNEQDLLVSSLRQQLKDLEKDNRKKTTLLEAYQASAGEADNIMKRKDNDIVKLKHDLSKKRSEHVEQIKSLEVRISSLVHSNQQLESRVVELMCRVDQKTHQTMMEDLRKNQARDKPAGGPRLMQGLENPTVLSQDIDNGGEDGDVDTTIKATSGSGSSSNGGSVSVVMAKDEVSTEGSTFFRDDKNGNFVGSGSGGMGRNPSLSLRSRAETDVYSDSGAASRSSFRVDSDVSMRSVSEDSLITTDSGCWNKG